MCLEVILLSINVETLHKNIAGAGGKVRSNGEWLLMDTGFPSGVQECSKIKHSDNSFLDPGTD